MAREIVQRASLVVLGSFVVVAGAASDAPRGSAAGLAIAALGSVLLAKAVRRRRRFPRARALIGT